MEGARFMIHAETAAHYLPIASDEGSTTWEIECVGGHLLYVHLDYEEEGFDRWTYEVKEFSPYMDTAGHDPWTSRQPDGDEELVEFMSNTFLIDPDAKPKCKWSYQGVWRSMIMKANEEEYISIVK